MGPGTAESSGRTSLPPRPILETQWGRSQTEQRQHTAEEIPRPLGKAVSLGVRGQDVADFSEAELVRGQGGGPRVSEGTKR